MLSIIPRTNIRLTRRTEIHKHQKNVATILEHTNATPLRGRGCLGYTCVYCPKEFAEPSDLKTHTKTTHDDEKLFFMKQYSMPNFIVKLDITNLTCNVCKQSISSLAELTTHLTSHDLPFDLSINNHIVPFVFDTEDLRCAICRHEYNNFKVLLEHMNSHYKNYVCAECGAGFVNKKTLLTHSYRHLKGEFKCSDCSKVFDTRVKMKEHHRAVHVCGNKRSKCGVCGEMFAEYACKRRHEASVHGARPPAAACRACAATFTHQRALTQHVRQYHLLEGRGRRANS